MKVDSLIILSVDLQVLTICISISVDTVIGVPSARIANDDSTTALDTNTDTSASNINTAGGLAASSFSSPPTIAQGTEDLSALEKIEKLKQQWLGLLP